jgi:hypothetical protein
MWLECGGLSVLTARLGDHRAEKRAVGCGLVTAFGPSACVSHGRPFVTRCRRGRGRCVGLGTGVAVGTGVGMGAGVGVGDARVGTARARRARRGRGSAVHHGCLPGRLRAPRTAGADLRSWEPPRRCDRRPSRAGGSDFNRQQQRQQSGRTPERSGHRAANCTKIGRSNHDGRIGTGLLRLRSVDNPMINGPVPAPAHRCRACPDVDLSPVALSPAEDAFRGSGPPRRHGPPHSRRDSADE